MTNCEDADTSRVRASQSPMVAGADTDTEGAIAALGSVMAMTLVMSANGQSAVLQAEVGHCALRV